MLVRNYTGPWTVFKEPPVLGAGGIAGVVVGVVAFLAAVIGAVVLWLKRRRERKEVRDGAVVYAAEGRELDEYEAGPPPYSRVDPEGKGEVERAVVEGDRRVGGSGPGG